MAKLKYIIGQKFGRLTVIEIASKSAKNTTYLCKCDCGKTIKVLRFNLINGKTKSCGCLRSELRSEDPPVNGGFVDGTCVNYITSCKLSKNNTSGIKGITWDKGTQKWRADITFKGVAYYLGRYDKIEDAKRIREGAENELHSNFLEWYSNQKGGVNNDKNK